MMRYLAILLAVILGAAAHARSGALTTNVSATVIPAANDLSTNWQKAGLAAIGGIPNITTQCGSQVSPSGLTPPTAGDDSSLIAAAITSCTSAKFVNLSSGHFVLDQTQNLFLNKSGVVLRGQGPGVTFIEVRNGVLPTYVAGGNNCGVNTSGIIGCTANNATIYMAPNGTFDWGYDGCGHQNPCLSGLTLTQDAHKGDTSVFVASTTGLSSGLYVLISESSGAQFLTDPIPGIGQTWASPDFLQTNTTPNTNKIVWALHSPSYGLDDFTTGQFPYNVVNNIGVGYGINADQATGEIHKITNSPGGTCPCRVDFDSPLTVDMRVYNPSGALFQGYISSGSGSSSPGSTLTVTSVTSGTIAINQPLWYAGITGAAAINYITAGSGTSWTTSNNQICCSGTSNTSISVGSPASPATFYGAGFNAQLHIPKTQSGGALTMVTQVGLENLTISRGREGNILMNFCAYCWIKNVETFGWYNGGVNMNATVRSQVDTIYCHDGYDLENNGTEYCLAMDGYSTENLVANSIFLYNGKSMVQRAVGGGNVVAYNVSDDTLYQATVTGNYWVDFSLNGSHFKGSHGTLFEGNYANHCGDDDTHGSVNTHTYFRNWCTGLRKAFSDPSFTNASSTTFNPTNAPNDDSANNTIGTGFATGNTYPYSAGTGPKRAFDEMAWNYNHAAVGNVFGTSGLTTSAKSWVLQGGYGGAQRGAIYMLGWTNISSAQSDPNIDGTGANPPWVWINGNYDYLNSTITWGRTSAFTLPTSLYLSVAPSFFGPGASCTYTWPWIDSTSGTPVKSNSCSGSGLPAKARADAGTPFVQP